MRAWLSIGILTASLAAGTTALAWVALRGGERVVPIPGGAVVLRPTAELKLPPVMGGPLSYDCNNPLVWDGDTLYSFTSHEHPHRSSGKSLGELSRYTRRVEFDIPANPGAFGGKWAEAVYRARSGRLYMWYHHEPKGLFPGHPLAHLTAPKVGQMVSDDNGLHWHDQGIILEAPRDSFDEGTVNHFFGGGFGDFSVIADADDRYLYVFVSTYHRDVAAQGVALARLATADLDDPAGKLRFWADGRWEALPSDGRVTPIFPAEASWHRDGTRTFWGPSVHWNTELDAYVIVMNRSKDPSFGQEGIYITTNPRLDDPAGWTTPVKLLDTKDWYPQVIGIDPRERGTDRLAGRVARLFVKGASTWEIEFRGGPGRP